MNTSTDLNRVDWNSPAPASFAVTGLGIEAFLDQLEPGASPGSASLSRRARTRASRTWRLKTHTGAICALLRRPGPGQVGRHQHDVRGLQQRTCPPDDEQPRAGTAAPARPRRQGHLHVFHHLAARAGFAAGPGPLREAVPRAARLAVPHRRGRGHRKAAASRSATTTRIPSRTSRMAGTSAWFVSATIRSSGGAWRRHLAAPRQIVSHILHMDRKPPPRSA
jgi:hypothetical protein